MYDREGNYKQGRVRKAKIERGNYLDHLWLIFGSSRNASFFDQADCSWRLEKFRTCPRQQKKNSAWSCRSTLDNDWQAVSEQLVRDSTESNLSTKMRELATQPEPQNITSGMASHCRGQWWDIHLDSVVATGVACSMIFKDMWIACMRNCTVVSLIM